MYTVVSDFFWKFHKSLKNFYAINQRLMARLKVNGHSTVVWYWSGDPMVPRSNPLMVRKFLLLSLLIWKGGFEILPNNTWDLLKKAYGTSKKLRFQFRGQLNKPFSEPTYLYTNLRAATTYLFHSDYNCIFSQAYHSKNYRLILNFRIGDLFWN